jgi:hypothetical protein
MSFHVLTGEVCQIANTLCSLVVLISQVNFVASNCVALLPISGSIAMPRPNVPMVVPSLGATL